MREYSVWHDENKNGKTYNHGILLVPVDKEKNLIKLLMAVRDEYRYDLNIDSRNDLKFKGCSKKPTCGKIVFDNLMVFKHIIQYADNMKSTSIYNSNRVKYSKEYKPYLNILESFDCKFGFLQSKDNFNSFSIDTYAKKVELTFRFLFKSCCHSMFDINNPIKITKFYFDGHEHHNGEIDLGFILKSEFKSYCNLSDVRILDSRQMENRDNNTKIMINFVDNIVGAFEAKLMSRENFKNILFPLDDIFERIQSKDIFKRKNSRWYKSINMSEVSIKNGNPTFEDLFYNKNQQNLFDNLNKF